MTIKELNDDEIIEKLRNWYSRNVIECPLCNKIILSREAIEYKNEDFEGKICKSCLEREENKDDEQSELIELKDDLEKLGYEIDVSEIQKIRNFGVNNKIMVTKEFMRKYFEIIELEGKELKEEIHKWLSENTIWCDRCEIRMINEMFENEEIICKDCKEEENMDETDGRMKRLRKFLESVGIIVTEGEIL
ncbi:hypothetical protein C1646_773193, partial [Rhizophagus diaphanus]